MMDSNDVKTINDKDKILTRKNYNNWIAKVACEFSNKIGMESLIMNGVEKVFEVERPNYKVAVILSGPFTTPPGRRLDGYITDEHGKHLELDERVQRNVDKEYDYKLKRNDRDLAAYESAKRDVVRYMNINVSPWIREKVKSIGNAYTDMSKKEDVIGIMGHLKRISTGKGAANVIADAREFLLISTKDVLKDMSFDKVVFDFEEAHDQLMNGRTAEQVLKGIIDGQFVLLMNKVKGLENQIEKLYEGGIYPPWKEMKDSFNTVLEEKASMREIMGSKESNHGMIVANHTSNRRMEANNNSNMTCHTCGEDSGLVYANFANDKIGKNKFKSDRYANMICFRCGEEGHAIRKCPSKVDSKYAVCGKSYHTKSHEVYTSMSENRAAATSKSKFKKKINGLSCEDIVENYSKENTDQWTICEANDANIEEDDEEEDKYSYEANVIRDKRLVNCKEESYEDFGCELEIDYDSNSDIEEYKCDIEEKNTNEEKLINELNNDINNLEINNFPNKDNIDNFNYDDVINKFDEYILELNSFKDIDKHLNIRSYKEIDKPLIHNVNNKSDVFKTELVDNKEYQYLC